jgi:hypothetical protein
MFATCAFCDGRLAGDGGLSGLGVGRRFAFDEWKGRLWVVCPRCARWNLAPFDDRLERIETLARLAAQGKLLAKTDEVALIRWQGYDLVRVGKPPRVELATWRYGERLKQRERERAKIVVPIALAGIGIAVAVDVFAGGSLTVFISNASTIGEWTYLRIMGNRLVRLDEPPICARCGAAMRLKAKHVQHARLLSDAHHDVALVLSCPACHEEGAELVGIAAARALRQGLTYLNARRRGRKRAADAARLVDQMGGPDELVRSVARTQGLIYRVEADRRLALEMAVDEQVEARELERQWREAEEIAQIADGSLGSTALEDQLRQLDASMKRNHPSG